VVRAVRIQELTTDTYQSVEHATNPVITPDANNKSWREVATHHVDPLLSRATGRDIVIADGNSLDYQIGALTTSDKPESGSKSTLSSTHTITGSFTTVGYDETVYDRDNALDASGYTAPKSGFYEITVTHAMGTINGTPSFRLTTELLNETQSRTLAYNNVSIDHANDQTKRPVDARFWLNEGDNVIVQVKTGSGSDETLELPSSFQAEYVHS